MSATVEQYTILISAPSDITEENEIKIVKNTIDKFNRIIGTKNGINLISKYWKEDAIPGMGDTPQNLLNKQIVDDSDAIITIFWTRFGSPTDSYNSGTEEEIMRLKNSSKQVFLYFSNCSLSPDSMNNEQYKKVVDFKERNKCNSLFFTYDDLYIFSELLYDHLINYFLTSLKKPKKKGFFDIKSFINGKLDNKLIFYNTTYCESKFIKDYKNNIINLFSSINKVNLVLSQAPMDINTAQTYQNLLGYPTKVRFSFSKKIEQEISEYALINKIELSSCFFDLGNLKEPQIVLVGFESIDGSDSEKNKYKLILQLYNKILILKGYLKYFSELDNYYCLDLIVLNTGELPDINLNITLFFPSNTFINIYKFPLPEYPCIDELNDFGTDFIEQLIMIKENYQVNKYDSYNYYSTVKNFIPDFLNRKSLDEIKEEEKDKYKQKLFEYFVYDYYVENDFEVIKFDIKYLKHNENMLFPTKLFFTSKVDKIIYEIRGENNPEIIKGDISV